MLTCVRNFQLNTHAIMFYVWLYKRSGRSDHDINHWFVNYCFEAVAILGFWGQK